MSGKNPRLRRDRGRSGECISSQEYRRQESPSMRTQFARISILQSSKIIVALYALLGLFYTAIGIMMLVFGGAHLRVMAVLYMAMPVILAIFGFIFFVIAAALYNLLAKIFGRIEIELKNVE